MTSPPSEELKACPFCGGEPYVIEDDRYNRCHVGCDCVAGPRIWQDVGFLSDAIAAWNRRHTSSRREVLEEAARVADKHYQESKKSAAYYKSLPKDDGSYGQCLADMIVAGDIAIVVRALEEEK